MQASWKNDCCYVPLFLPWASGLESPAACPFNAYLKVEDWQHKQNLMYLGIVLTRTGFFGDRSLNIPDVLGFDAQL